MTDYYKILNVPQDASTAEIKSAYRKLARKKHPDVNESKATASQEFSQIADAYKVLSDPQTRAYYDRQLLKAKFSKEDSFFDMKNAHANRAKQIVYERRYNAIIDRMIAEERKESMALQEIIFPIVSLFISTGFVAVFKPVLWAKSNMLGKMCLLTLFIIGVFHLLKRLHAGFERYTYSTFSIHDSLFNEIEEETRPYTRTQAMTFLIIGLLISLFVGLAISGAFHLMETPVMSRFFSARLSLEIFFYPPIAVLCVDIIHRFSSRFEY